MELTPQRKADIDSLSYADLLERWRFAPAGAAQFQGETGKYFAERMASLRAEGANHTRASKMIGWERSPQWPKR